MVVNNNMQELEVRFRRWFVILNTFAGIVTIFFSLFYVMHAVRDGLTITETWRCTILIGLTFTVFWLFARILFYSVKATKAGLESKNLLERTTTIPWHEIVEIRKSRIFVSTAFRYVISSRGHKLLLIRNLKNYHKLIDMIKDKAPNLKVCDR